MTKDAIHGHNSAVSGLHFPLSSSSSSSLASHEFSLLWIIFFNSLNMTIYRKEPRGVEKFAQASWLLMDEEISLAQASWMLAWMNGCLKS